MSKKVSEILNESMSKVRDMVDSNTVVGTPVQVTPNVTLIPISRISFNLASGGVDLDRKDKPSGTFGGGSGCSVKIVPVAMIFIEGDHVRMMPIDEPASTAAERVVEQIPMLIDKLSELIRGKDQDISDI